MRSARSVIIAAALTIAAPAIAQHSDIILTRDAAGARVLTNTFTSSGIAPARVFQATLGDSGFANRTTNPGVNAEPGNFYTNAQAGLQLRRAVRKWSSGHACAVPVETIALTKLGVTGVSPSVDPVNGEGPSVTLGITDPLDGFLHEHGAFALGAPASSGVYVLEVQAWAGSPGAASPAPSLPFWIIFRQNVPQSEADACVQFITLRLSAGASGLGALCPCTGDFNADGVAGVQDVFDFLAAWFIADPRADINNAGGVSVQDIFDFLTAWFGGCAA